MKSGVLFVGSLEFLTNLQKNHLIAIVLIDVTLKNNVWKNNSISRNNFIKFSDKGGYRQYIRETGRKKKKRPSKTGEKKKERTWGKKMSFELHSLNLWDTGGSSEHKENYADIFKAKLSGWVQAVIGSRILFLF